MDKGGLQLLPEARRRITIESPGAKKAFSAGLVILILVVAGIVGTGFYIASLDAELLALDDAILSIERQRDKDTEEEILTLERQLSLINILLGNHVFWSGGFGRFERAAHPQVRYSNFSVSNDTRKFEATIVAANYSALAKQVSAYLADDAITDVDINRTEVLTTGQVQANISIEFDPAKLLRKK